MYANSNSYLSPLVQYYFTSTHHVVEPDLIDEKDWVFQICEYSKCLIKQERTYDLWQIVKEFFGAYHVMVCLT